MSSNIELGGIFWKEGTIYEKHIAKLAKKQQCVKIDSCGPDFEHCLSCGAQNSISMGHVKLL